MMLDALSCLPCVTSAVVPKALLNFPAFKFCIVKKNEEICMGLQLGCREEAERCLLWGRTSHRKADKDGPPPFYSNEVVQETSRR